MNSETVICKRCVMDTTDPEISFDERGFCNHCIAAEEKLKAGWFPNEEGSMRLQLAAAEIKAYGKNKTYDCIIGISGGVDSSYLLHVAKHDMGLRPLAVHVDAGWNSEIAVKNIENLVRKLELELFTYVVDWEEIRDLQLAFLKSSIANQDVPQDHVFFATLYDFASKNGIKYVLTGSNLTSESILPNSWGYTASDARQIIAIHKRFGGKKFHSYKTMSLFKYKIFYPFIKKMKVIRPLNWMNYDKNKTIKFLEENYGWRYYGTKHGESKWTRFFQNDYLPTKFGYDKRKAHLSSLIMAGQMTRDEAMKDLEKPLYDPLELKNDEGYVSKKLGISEDRLEELMSLPNKTYQDYPNNENVLRFLRKVYHIFLR